LAQKERERKEKRKKEKEKQGKMAKKKKRKNKESRQEAKAECRKQKATKASRPLVYQRSLLFVDSLSISPTVMTKMWPLPIETCSSFSFYFGFER